MRKIIGFAALLSLLSVFSLAADTLKCDSFPGEDGGKKLSACIAALPTTGGTADARGLQGEQQITTDIFGGASKPATLLLGKTTFVLSGAGCVNVPSSWTIQGTYESVFKGRGACSGAEGRTVMTRGSYVSLNGFKVEGSNGPEQCIAILDGHNDTVENVWADHCGQYSIMVSNNEPAVAHAFENIQIVHNRITNIGNPKTNQSIGIEVFAKPGEAFEKDVRGRWNQLSPMVKDRKIPELLAPGIVIAHNDVSAGDGMYVGGCGIKIGGSYHGRVENNVVDISRIKLDSIGNAGGICSVNSDGVLIAGNKITGGVNGIAVSGSLDARNPHRTSNAIIRNNTLIDQFENGFFSGEGQDGLTIENNTITNTLKTAQHGIYLMKSTEWAYRKPTVLNNVISGYPAAVIVEFKGARAASKVTGNRTEGKVVVR